LKVPLDDGTEQTFVPGEYSEKTVSLDFTDGDISIIPEVGSVLTKVDIVKPATLLPENIAKDVVVAGIKGTYSAGGSEDEVPSKAVNFYDQFGNIMYSYTRAEAAALTELPPGPEIEGFEFDCWTRTLEEVQTVQFFADIGPAYKKNGYPCAVLVLDIPDTDLTARVYLDGDSYSPKAVIDWGDGSAESPTTINSSNYQIFYHAYTSSGIKYVGIYNTGPTNSTLYLGSFDSSDKYSVVDTGVSNLNKASELISPEFKLISVLCGSTALIRICQVNGNQRLRMISDASIRHNYSDTGRSYILYYAPALEVIARKEYYSSLNSSHMYQVPSLKRFHGDVGSTVADKCLMYSDSMTDLWLGSYTTGAYYVVPTMNVNRRVIIPRTTPPTQRSTTTIVKWGDGLIYVPDSAVEAYKTSELFASVVDCIRPISEYPDY
jgi:hypothetical protein